MVRKNSKYLQIVVKNGDLPWDRIRKKSPWTNTSTPKRPQDNCQPNTSTRTWAVEQEASSDISKIKILWYYFCILFTNPHTLPPKKNGRNWRVIRMYFKKPPHHWPNLISRPPIFTTIAAARHDDISSRRQREESCRCGCGTGTGTPWQGRFKGVDDSIQRTKRKEFQYTINDGPPKFFSIRGFILSYTHLYLVLSRVYWGLSWVVPFPVCQPPPAYFSISVHLPMLLGRGDNPKHTWMTSVCYHAMGSMIWNFVSPGVSSCYTTIVFFCYGWF